MHLLQSRVGESGSITVRRLRRCVSSSAAKMSFVAQLVAEADALHEHAAALNKEERFDEAKQA